MLLGARRNLLTQSIRHLSRHVKVIEPLSATVRWTHTDNSNKRYQGLLAPFFAPSAEEAAEDVARRHYPRLTAYDSAKCTSPPTRTQMLVRDFIDDSLYNPNYGYFSKQAVIFSPEHDFDFNNMRDHLEFMNKVGQLYKDMEEDADEVDEVARQVWHTPTELFKVSQSLLSKKRETVLMSAIALVWIRCCKISGLRIQVEPLPAKGFNHL